MNLYCVVYMYLTYATSWATFQKGASMNFLLGFGRARRINPRMDPDTNAIPIVVTMPCKAKTKE